MKKHSYHPIDRREAVFLFALVLLLFVLFNLLNFSGNRWTLHPDDHDIYVFSKVLLTTGRLWYKTPYNEKFRTTAFQPGLDRYSSGGNDRFAVRAAYSPGIYAVTAPGHLAGPYGPFFIVSSLGIMGVLFLYFFVREVFDRGTAMVAAVFLGSCAAYAYWSNMLFSNVPALAFFTGGLYFLAKTVSLPGRRTYYFLAVIMFILSVWVRYDYILLVAVVGLVTLVAYRRNLNRRFAAQSGLLALASALVVGVANFLMSGSVTGIKGAYGAAGKSTGEVVRYLPKLSLGAVARNAWMYIAWVAPIMVILGVLGAALVLLKKRSGFAWMLLLIPLVVLVLFGKSTGFWGYGKNWLASSYTRYFLPVFMCLAVLAAVFTVWAARKMPLKSAGATLVLILVALQLAASAYVLFGNQFGLTFTDRYNGNRKSVDAFFSAVPAGAVVIDLSSDNYFRFVIVSRPVLNPSYFPQEQAGTRLAEIIEELRAEGAPVYVINNPERSMMDPAALDRENGSITVRSIGNPAVFQYGSRTPDVYTVDVTR